MQPPVMIHTAHSPAKTARGRPRYPRAGIGGSATGRVLGFDRRDTLALLERHRRLLHDRLVALHSCLAAHWRSVRISGSRLERAARTRLTLGSAEMCLSRL